LETLLESGCRSLSESLEPLRKPEEICGSGEGGASKIQANTGGEGLENRGSSVRLNA
jgi:hypothetical protein